MADPIPPQEDIKELTSQLTQSVAQLKRVYNEYKEEENKKEEDADAVLDEIQK